MKSVFVFLVLIIFSSCASQRPVSGTILDKETGNPVIGAKIYNKAKTYESDFSDSLGQFYFLSPRSLLTIRPIKVIIEKESYKPAQIKYRNIEPKDIRLESVNSKTRI